MKFHFSFLFIMVCVLLGCATPVPAYKFGDKVVYDNDNYVNAYNAWHAASSDYETQRIKLLKGKFPKYPREAERKEIEGKVVVRISVNEKGLVDDVQILSSPHDLLSEACIEGLKTWRFAPVLENGSPIKFQLNQSFPFQLDPPI
jgi:TonB family protein